MWSDRETDRDCLGFSSYVSVLAGICMSAELAPLTLGIFGSWGSGKTSLMQMLKTHIDARKDPNTRTLWFNAWRYEGREEGQAALIHAILAQLERDLSLGGQAKDLVKKVKDNVSALKLGKHFLKTALTLTPDVQGFIDCFRDESDRVANSMQSFEEDFQKLLTEAKLQRILVFIDDLDRCSSPKVIETFETIKLFLNTPACTFVIGADAPKIERAVGEVHLIPDAPTRRAYLEKIVQMPFTIPAQRLPDIACYVAMLIMGRQLKENGWGKLITARPEFYAAPDLHKACAEWVALNKLDFDFDEGGVDGVLRQLEDILPHVDIVARGLRGNPRQLKRFLNTLGLRHSLAKANALAIDARILIKLAVLEYAWPEFFDVLVETTDPTTGRNPIIEAVLGSEHQKAAQESKLVSDSLGRPGLVEYLRSDPTLSGDSDLGPYLFLAQTSVPRGEPVVLRPAEEETRKLVSDVESDDALRSKAGAQRLSASEVGIVGAAVRQLIVDLPNIKEAAVQTHVVRGLGIVCQRHTDLLPPVLAAITSLSFEQKEGLALAASALVTNAERAGHPANPEFVERLKKASSLVQALAPTERKKRRER